MDKLIGDFSKELAEAMKIGAAAKLHKSKRKIQSVLVCGMGGSGIGANLVQELCAAELEVPFMVNKSYHLPNWVNENTLLIACSYSGNTEETLHSVKEAKKRGCTICCVCSGGKMKQEAEKNGWDLIELPGGRPPRASLGYSFIQQLYILKYHELIGEKVLRDLKASIKLLDAKEDEIRAEAGFLADNIYNKIPVIYVNSDMESVAIRYRQQLNENGKMLCWHHVIPEMNHNELVGWRGDYENVAVIMLRNDDDFSRVSQRIDLNMNTFSATTPSLFEIFSHGKSKTERALFLIHMGDWLSFYISRLRGYDAVEVRVIDQLKADLASLSW